MERIALNDGSLEVTRLGFGCASIMRLPTSRRRQALLGAAADEGIRHFDVARMYGLGRAEGELARFAKTRRANITIATKFGIEPAAGLGSLGRLQAPARAFLERFPSARQLVKRRSEAFSAPRQYDVVAARRSLETSLRELGTDYVDIFFVHDPTPRDDMCSDQLREFLTDEKERGTIRAFGVSQDAHPGLSVVGSLGDGALLQERDDILTRAARPRQPDFAFGAVGFAHARITSALTTHREMRERWRGELGHDPLLDGSLGTMLLVDALDANPDGVVLYNTLKRERLAEAGRVLRDTPSPTRIQKLRALVAADRSTLDGARG